MSRIIGGIARGRRLLVPKAGTRPTSDRVRESLFSILDSRISNWGELRVLDLYAGSGALGLEAISRGAASVTLVDSAAGAISIIKKNAAVVGVAGTVEICKAPAATWISSFEPGATPYSLVFLDPPYEVANTALSEIIGQLAAYDLLAVGALIVVERSARDQSFEFDTNYFEPVLARKYGDTVIAIAITS